MCWIFVLVCNGIVVILKTHPKKKHELTSYFLRLHSNNISVCLCVRVVLWLHIPSGTFQVEPDCPEGWSSIQVCKKRLDLSKDRSLALPSAFWCLHIKNSAGRRWSLPPPQCNWGPWFVESPWKDSMCMCSSGFPPLIVHFPMETPIGSNHD